MTTQATDRTQQVLRRVERLAPVAGVLLQAPEPQRVVDIGMRAYACHPLFGPGSVVLGALSFGTRSREASSADELPLMRAVTGPVAAAVVRRRDRRDLRRLDVAVAWRVDRLAPRRNAPGPGRGDGEQASWAEPAGTAAAQAAPGPGQRVRVLVVDDHAVMRQGLSMLLEGESDIEVVGVASDGAEAVREAELRRPDVILMDFSMPVMDGVEATRAITARLPRTRVIGLSMYEEADCAAAMLDAGAVAYVSKSEGPGALLDAIRRAAVG